MGERTLNEQILDVLSLAIKPFSAGDIRRRLTGSIDAGEISSRLSKMKSQGKVACTDIPSQAITGPRKIKGWVAVSNPLTLEYIPDIAKTQQNSEIASRQVASVASVTSAAA